MSDQDVVTSQPNKDNKTDGGQWTTRPRPDGSRGEADIGENPGETDCPHSSPAGENSGLFAGQLRSEGGSHHHQGWDPSPDNTRQLYNGPGHIEIQKLIYLTMFWMSKDY